MVGVNDNREFNVGDKINVKIVTVNLAKKQVDFEYIGSEKS